MCHRPWDFITVITKSFKFQATELGVGTDTSFCDRQDVGDGCYLMIDMYYIRYAFQCILTRVIEDFKRLSMTDALNMNYEDVFKLEVSIDSHSIPGTKEIKSDIDFLNSDIGSNSRSNSDIYLPALSTTTNKDPIMFRVRIVSNYRRYGCELFFPL